MLVMKAPILGGSWVVVSRVISRITMVITYIRGLITLLITTHEPPSSSTVSGQTLTGRGPNSEFALHLPALGTRVSGIWRWA